MHINSVKALAILFIHLVIAVLAIGQNQGASLDRSAFYSTMSSQQIEDVDKQLKIIGASTIAGRDAFQGALLMKKAGLTAEPHLKLKYFKSGHKKLEAAIQKDSGNVEYRFLRLMIQEHAPGFLAYRGDMKKDSAYIRKSYKNLTQAVQQAVQDYSKQSKILRPTDF
ncbi:MAG: hypothetical protein ACHQET_02795 [Chitinophagales bacterium]